MFDKKIIKDIKKHEKQWEENCYKPLTERKTERNSDELGIEGIPICN